MITVGRLMSSHKDPDGGYFKVAAELENENVKPSLETDGMRSFFCPHNLLSNKLEHIKLGCHVAVLWSFDKYWKEEAKDVCVVCDLRREWEEEA